jgi:hypothetical protein
MKQKVEKISRLEIKQAFSHEAKELTPWLCENIDVLGEAIGIELYNPIKEQSTGNFNVDIKAENSNGDIVVIENQFGSSDHDHLGKLITYLTSFEAKIAVWIVEKPKQEHINALNWLNETDNGCDFYLLSIEAIKIGNSNPAPLLTSIVRPSDEAKSIGKIKKEVSEKLKMKKEFWTLLLDRLRENGESFFNDISPTQDSWIGATAKNKGLTYVFWVNQKNSRLELRIDRGKGSEQENLKIFNELKKHQSEIENKFGDSITWEENEGFRSCAIRIEINEGGFMNPPNEWNSITSILATKMSSLISATQPFIKKLTL